MQVSLRAVELAALLDVMDEVWVEGCRLAWNRLSVAQTRATETREAYLAGLDAFLLKQGEPSPDGPSQTTGSPLSPAGLSGRGVGAEGHLQPRRPARPREAVWPAQASRRPADPRHQGLLRR